MDASKRRRAGKVRLPKPGWWPGSPGKKKKSRVLQNKKSQCLQVWGKVKNHPTGRPLRDTFQTQNGVGKGEIKEKGKVGHAG